MGRRDAGKIDPAAVASLAAALAACVALVTLGVVSWHVRQDNQRMALTLGVESLWHLTDQWNSSAMLGIRSAAAAGLLSRQPTRDVDEVLNFFDEIVLLLNRGALDEELTAHYFYWPSANYWRASREYVQDLQRDDPSAWKEAGTLVNRLAAIEARRSNRPVAAMLPSNEQVQRFLLDEQGTDECSEDSDAQKTPL